jgi:hypothetical protein
VLQFEAIKILSSIFIFASPLSVLSLLLWASLRVTSFFSIAMSEIFIINGYSFYLALEFQLPTS